jgi:heme o synthase
MKELDHILLTLKAGRWKLSIATALSAVSGALLEHPEFNVRIAAIFMGAIMFALAVTWLNQIQERQDDGSMERTKNRPLVNHTLPLRYPVIWAALCSAVSLGIFSICGGWPAIVVLICVASLYNGIYTTMKRRSPFALIPGAIAGAAPPVLGWICAGGEITDIMPVTLFLIFFIWQVPHFWLTAAHNKFDYEAARFPLPWNDFANLLYVQIVVIWITAFIIMLLALPAFNLVQSTAAQLTILIESAALLAGLVLLVIKNPHLLGHLLNLSMASACVLLVAERMVGG